MTTENTFFEVQDNDANQTLVRVVEHFMDEMQNLHEFIMETCAEIQSVKGEVTGSSSAVSLQSELEAVVKDAAEATNTILDAVEEIQKIIDKLAPDAQNALTEYTTKIFEACSFQDLTGQRVSKAVKALGAVEDKVEKLLVTFTDIQIKLNPESALPKKKDKLSDADLMNGPQLEAPDQNSIDDLFSKL